MLINYSKLLIQACEVSCNILNRCCNSIIQRCSKLLCLIDHFSSCRQHISYLTQKCLNLFASKCCFQLCCSRCQLAGCYLNIFCRCSFSVNRCIQLTDRSLYCFQSAAELAQFRGTCCQLLFTANISCHSVSQCICSVCIILHAFDYFIDTIHILCHASVQFSIASKVLLNCIIQSIRTFCIAVDTVCKCSGSVCKCVRSTY